MFWNEKNVGSPALFFFIKIVFGNLESFMVPCEFQDFSSILLNKLNLLSLKGLPGGSDGKASVCNSEDLGSIPGQGRSPREGNGNPLQYSCLENPVENEA